MLLLEGDPCSDIPITTSSDAWKGKGETICTEASDDECMKCQIFDLRILRCIFVMLERSFHHYTGSTWAMQRYDSERCLPLLRASFQGRNNHLPNCKTWFNTELHQETIANRTIRKTCFLLLPFRSQMTSSQSWNCVLHKMPRTDKLKEACRRWMPHQRQLVFRRFSTLPVCCSR